MLRVGICSWSNRSAQLVRELAPSLAQLGAEFTAVSDPSVEAVAAGCAALELDLAERGYADFSRMLGSGAVDAVLVGSPMQFHAAQTIEALEHGVHVLCEVTACCSLEEARAVVAAAARSSARYMMAENYYYARDTLFIAGLVAAGRFGQPYYAEAEYLIYMRSRSTEWRREHMVGRRGCTYATHVLSPVIAWFRAALPDDRIVSLSCVDPGSHYTDEQGELYASDGAVMMCRMASGGLIKVRCDLVSARPGGGTRLVLQGTRGVFETTDGGMDGAGRISLLPPDEKDANASTEPKGAESQARAVHRGGMSWQALSDLQAQEEARHETEESSAPPMDLVRMFSDFVALCRGGDGDESNGQEGELTGGLHGAMDLTLPGLISELSCEREGAWMDVPDSREWILESERAAARM